MLLEHLPATVADETNYSNQPLGPSSRSCCKVLSGSSCGSGSLVGVRNGKSLILTNAHVAGTRIGAAARCTFPFLNNRTFDTRIIMAAYSDRVMMDWCILEAQEEIQLPHIKLSIQAPEGEHYTGGYPRCQGPLFQRLRTRQITHNGTVWRWQPNSIGGQSGSGVHSFADNLQRGLLTWSWGGDGAGQTTRSIWFQYVNQSEVGFRRPDDLIELSEVNPEIESGFFAESNITSLPIWSHLGGDDGGGGDNPPPPGGCEELAAKVLQGLGKVDAAIKELTEMLKTYKPPASSSGNDPATGSGSTFGL